MERQERGEEARSTLMKPEMYEGGVKSARGERMGCGKCLWIEVFVD